MPLALQRLYHPQPKFLGTKPPGKIHTIDESSGVFDSDSSVEINPCDKLGGAISSEDKSGRRSAALFAVSNENLTSVSPEYCRGLS